MDAASCTSSVAGLAAGSRRVIVGARLIGCGVGMLPIPPPPPPQPATKTAASIANKCGLRNARKRIAGSPCTPRARAHWLKCVLPHPKYGLNVLSVLPGSHVLSSDRKARSESGALPCMESSLTCGDKARSIAEAASACHGILGKPQPLLQVRCSRHNAT